MAQKAGKICPECKGKKFIPGNCVCDAEWRGTQNGDDWNECQCNKEEPCPICLGTGLVNEEDA